MRRRHSANSRLISFVVAIAVLVGLAQPARAQTFRVIHLFDGRGGSNPVAGLTIDRGGNLYGTTAWGGTTDNGTVYELKRTGSGFLFDSLHSFSDGDDGAFPLAPLTIGPDGSLYGTSYVGGPTQNGTVYRVRPSPTPCGSALCPWNETVLYRFARGADGGDPWAGVVFDAAGNIYGATVNGGNDDVGVVYELQPAGGAWTEHVLYSFAGGDHGANPLGGLVFDVVGNLYGTTESGGLGSGYGNGVIYELSPSGSGWVQRTLYEFRNNDDGREPEAGLTLDGSGNLYGSTPCCGSGGGGTVFSLTPSGGSWNFTLLYSLVGSLGPQGNLVMDSRGALYGTSENDGRYDMGSVFRLTPDSGGWTYTTLHDFTGGSDGAHPSGGLVLDNAGNLYGTTYQGGLSGCVVTCGVVFEITP